MLRTIGSLQELFLHHLLVSLYELICKLTKFCMGFIDMGRRPFFFFLIFLIWVFGVLPCSFPPLPCFIWFKHSMIHKWDSSLLVEHI
jgi:hypothetical protein